MYCRRNSGSGCEKKRRRLGESSQGLASLAEVALRSDAEPAAPPVPKAEPVA